MCYHSATILEFSKTFLFENTIKMRLFNSMFGQLVSSISVRSVNKFQDRMFYLREIFINVKFFRSTIEEHEFLERIRTR